METKLCMPFAYTSMDEEEMTYVDGGSVIDSAAATVGNAFQAVVGLAYGACFAISLFQGIVSTRLWYKSYLKENPDSTVSEQLDAALAAVSADMNKSAWNSVRDLGRGICMAVAFPLTAVCVLL
jgi:hypothetical protein